MNVVATRALKWQISAGGIVILVIAAVIIAWWWPVPSESNTVAPSGRPSDPTWFLYAADSHGAVVVARHEMVGVARSGAVKWRSQGEPAMVACNGTCPAAVLSGSISSMNSALARTPRPHWVGPVHGRVAVPDDHHTQEYIVAAQGGSLVRYVSDKGKGKWEVRSERANPVTRDADGYMPMWMPNSDGSAAVGLLQSSRGDDLLAQLFVHDSAVGWRFAGPVRKSKGSPAAVCASAKGKRYLAGGRRMYRLDGPSSRLPEDFPIGACTFTRDHLVVSSNSMTIVDGRKTHATQVATYTLEGKRLGARHLPIEGLVVGDVNSDHFLIVGGGAVSVYDVRSRHRIWHRKGVDAATFDERGEVVFVTHEGSAQWHKFR